MTLVRDIDKDPVKRALASALVTFSNEIRATITAEGIETSHEQATLIRLGIPDGQGYHLGRPAPVPTPGDRPRTRTKRRQGPTDVV